MLWDSQLVSHKVANHKCGRDTQISIFGSNIKHDNSSSQTGQGFHVCIPIPCMCPKNSIFAACASWDLEWSQICLQITHQRSFQMTDASSNIGISTNKHIGISRLKLPRTGVSKCRKWRGRNPPPPPRKIKTNARIHIQKYHKVPFILLFVHQQLGLENSVRIHLDILHCSKSNLGQNHYWKKWVGNTYYDWGRFSWTYDVDTDVAADVSL